MGPQDPLYFLEAISRRAWSQALPFAKDFTQFSMYFRIFFHLFGFFLRFLEKQLGKNKKEGIAINKTLAYNSMNIKVYRFWYKVNQKK